MHDEIDITARMQTCSRPGFAWASLGPIREQLQTCSAVKFNNDLLRNLSEAC